MDFFVTISMRLLHFCESNSLSIETKHKVSDAVMAIHPLEGGQSKCKG